MQYRSLGSTGMTVSPLCLGAMMFGAADDPDAAIGIIHQALDAGINIICEAGGGPVWTTGSVGAAADG